MPSFNNGDVSIYYEEYGSGYPLILFAPGALLSAIDLWHKDPPSPIDHIKELASDFRLVAMDQRNAGRSAAPIRASDGWQSYAEDHIALMDHLGIHQAVALGSCIGASFILRLFQDAPERIVAGVLQQPIGRENDAEPWTTRQVDLLVEGMPENRRPSREVAEAFARNLYEPGFVYSVSRDFVRSCGKPMLVLPGEDKAHPYQIARDVADLAPNAEFVDHWRNDLAATTERIRNYLKSHVPDR